MIPLNVFCTVLFLMLAGHAVADGPALQPGTLSQGKRAPAWADRWRALLIHGFTHGGAVALATGIWWLGVAEVIMHIAIDRQKCAGRLTMIEDQISHGLCKVLWACVATLILAP